MTIHSWGERVYFILTVNSLWSAGSLVLGPCWGDWQEAQQSLFNLVAGSKEPRRPCLIISFKDTPSKTKDLPLGPTTPWCFQIHGFGFGGDIFGSKPQQCCLPSPVHSYCWIFLRLKSMLSQCDKLSTCISLHVFLAIRIQVLQMHKLE